MNLSPVVRFPCRPWLDAGTLWATAFATALCATSALVRAVPAMAPVVSLAPGVPIAQAEPDLTGRWECEFDITSSDLASRKRSAAMAAQTYRSQALILTEDRDPTDVILRRTEALAADIQKLPRAPNMTVLKDRLVRRKAQAGTCTPDDLPARKALFMSIAALRRQIAFFNPLLNFKELLFVKSYLGASHCCDQFFGNTARPGGSVYLLDDPFGPRPVLRDILAGTPVSNGRLQGKALAGGSFRTPELSYDGKQIFFAATQCGRGGRVWSPETSYHVFKAGLDGSALTQVFCMAVDDAHAYHTTALGKSNPGRGWVMVRAKNLTAESIILAMEAGDYYASSGVTLTDVRRGGNRLELEIDAQPGVTYLTRFIGTRIGYDPTSQPLLPPDGKAAGGNVSHRRYSEQLGAVLAEVAGQRAAYVLHGDELYVRAKIISSKPKPNASVANEVECAWTQPLAGTAK